jgi:hypothetical protein
MVLYPHRRRMLRALDGYLVERDGALAVRCSRMKINHSCPTSAHMNKRRAINIACGVVAAIVAVGVLLPMTVATRSPKTCTLCRAERIDRKVLGYS